MGRNALMLNKLEREEVKAMALCAESPATQPGEEHGIEPDEEQFVELLHDMVRQFNERPEFARKAHLQFTAQAPSGLQGK